MNINRSTDSILQSILNVFNVNRADAGNKAGTVEKHQLKTFFEDSSDEDVKLEIKDTPSETTKVKAGERGSTEYIKNLLKLPYIDDLKYDEQGRISSFSYSSSKGGYEQNTCTISYLDNGNIEIMEQNFRLGQRFYTYDQNGNIVNTPNVKEGERGSVEFISSLIDIEKETIEEDTIKKDNQDRITYFEIGIKTYEISYNNDNTITVQTSALSSKKGKDGTVAMMAFGTNYGSKITYSSDKEKIREEISSNGFTVGPRAGFSTVLEYEKGEVIKESKIWDSENYHNGIKTEVTTYNKDGSTTVKKFDVDGKEVTSRPELAHDEVGSLSYLQKILNFGAEYLKPTYDEQGRICELNYDENYMTNGLVLTSDERFVRPNYDETLGYEVTKCEVTYNSDETVSVRINGNNSTIKNYDKDGNEIKSTLSEKEKPAEVPKEPEPSVAQGTTETKETQNPTTPKTTSTTTPTSSPNPTVTSVRTTPNQKTPQQNNIGASLSQRIKNIQQQLSKALGNVFSRTKISSNRSILNVFKNVLSKIN